MDESHPIGAEPADAPTDVAVDESSADPADEQLDGAVAPEAASVALTSSTTETAVSTWTQVRHAEKLDASSAVQAYEQALRLYQGDLLESPAVLNYRWMYDDEPQVALTFRSDYRRRRNEARRRLADLLTTIGDPAGLSRAEELYLGLCGEEPEDERLWIALFRIHERTGSSMSLDSAVRRLQGALVELGAADGTDNDSVPLLPNLERIVGEIRFRVGGQSRTSSSL